MSPTAGSPEVGEESQLNSKKNRKKLGVKESDAHMPAARATV